MSNQYEKYSEKAAKSMSLEHSRYLPDYADLKLCRNQYEEGYEECSNLAITDLQEKDNQIKELVEALKIAKSLLMELGNEDIPIQRNLEQMDLINLTLKKYSNGI